MYICYIAISDVYSIYFRYWMCPISRNIEYIFISDEYLVYPILIIHQPISCIFVIYQPIFDIPYIGYIFDIDIYSLYIKYTLY